MGKQTCSSDQTCYLCCGETEDKTMSVWGDLGDFWVNHEGGMRVGQVTQEESHGEQHMLSPRGTELQVG